MGMADQELAGKIAVVTGGHIVRDGDSYRLDV